jgi:hypothetical protein
MHRSGTTLLYQMLAASDRFNVLTAWHVICFDELQRGLVDQLASRERLARRFSELGIVDRRIDAVQVVPQTPEEYGFILDNLGAGRRLNRSNLHTLLHVCDVVQSTCANRLPLILKNPFDYTSGRLIRRWFPDARIIYIHRHPLDVAASQLRMIRQEILTPDPYLFLLSARYRSFQQNEFAILAARTIMNRYERQAAGFAAARIRRIIADYVHAREVRGHDRFAAFRSFTPSLTIAPAIDDPQFSPNPGEFHVWYEQLCRHPNEIMKEMLHWLGVDGQFINFAPMIHPRGVIARSAFLDLISPTTTKRLADCAELLGYEQ